MDAFLVLIKENYIFNWRQWQALFNAVVEKWAKYICKIVWHH